MWIQVKGYMNTKLEGSVHREMLTGLCQQRHILVMIAIVFRDMY